MEEVFRRYIMLTNAKVTGKYKYTDKFQILPAPDHFPQAPYLEAHHPCILEFKYNFTSDQSKKMQDDDSVVPDWIQQKDYEAKIISEITTLFDVFSFSKFIEPQDRHGWTIDINANPIGTPEWRQFSFIIDDHHYKISDFTPTEYSKIATINTDKFYKLGARYIGSDFSIPDLFDDILDTYYSLDQDSKSALLKSATIFKNAVKIKPISPSVSFACFVSAIESLVDHIHKDEKTEKCKECNAPRYSVTKKFTDFLSKYGSDSDELIRFYKKAYNKRSKILHAGALFLGEHIPRDWGENNWEAFHMNSGIERICRIALANWLLERYTPKDPS